MAIGRKREAVISYVLVAVVLIVFMTPIYLIISSSLKPAPIMFSRPPAFLFKPTLQNYYDLFTMRPFYLQIINSLIAALGSTIVSVSFGSLAAYAISRVKARWMNDVAFWILSMRMFPPIAVVVPYYIIFKTIGLLDTPWALIIVYSTFNIPLTVWLMKGFFDEVPTALEEAAQLDGHGVVATFVHVVLPLTAPGARCRRGVLFHLLLERVPFCAHAHRIECADGNGRGHVLLVERRHPVGPHHGRLFHCAYPRRRLRPHLPALVGEGTDHGLRKGLRPSTSPGVIARVIRCPEKRDQAIWIARGCARDQS